MAGNRMQIAVDMETYDEIAKMARENGRTIGKQVTMMLKQVKRNTQILNVTGVDQVPYPLGAEPIAIVTAAPIPEA